jgi:ketosteroid isomerase-like protein
MEEPINVVLRFEELINSRRAEEVCSLLTPDSVLIDSMGNRTEGASKLLSAWTGYFKMVPDYTISHSEILASGELVAVFGSAKGTFTKDGNLRKEDYWETPAAWRAIVNNGKIALWQVFADNEPIRAIMRKYE